MEMRGLFKERFSVTDLFKPPREPTYLELGVQSLSTFT